MWTVCGTVCALGGGPLHPPIPLLGGPGVKHFFPSFMCSTHVYIHMKGYLSFHMSSVHEGRPMVLPPGDEPNKHTVHW